MGDRQYEFDPVKYGQLLERDWLLPFGVTEMKRALCLLFALAACGAYADDTTINYKGQPVPSAIAPSIQSMGNDVCLVAISGAVSTTIVGISGGSYLTDANCERIKLSRELANQGLKVASIALLCQDERVWEAMEMSGSPCPVGGSVGDVARGAWKKLTPKRFEKLYGKVPADPSPADSGGK